MNEFSHTRPFPFLRSGVMLATAALLLASIALVGCDEPDENSVASRNRIPVFLSRQSLPADGASTTTLNVFFYNRDGSPASGFDAIVSTTLGSIVEGNTFTVSGGEITATLQASGTPGTAFVTIETVGYIDSSSGESYQSKLSNTVSVPFLSPEHQVTLRSATGGVNVAPGTQFGIEAVVTDFATGARVPAGVEVDFAFCSFVPDGGGSAPDQGGFDTTQATTNENGIATVVYTGPTGNSVGAELTIAAWSGSLVPDNIMSQNCPPEDRTVFPGYDIFTLRTVLGTATPTPSPSPTFTPSPTPSNTPVPTETPSPTPTAGFSPTPTFTFFRR